MTILPSEIIIACWSGCVVFGHVGGLGESQANWMFPYGEAAVGRLVETVESGVARTVPADRGDHVRTARSRHDRNVGDLLVVRGVVDRPRRVQHLAPLTGRSGEPEQTVVRRRVGVACGV